MKWPSADDGEIATVSDDGFIRLGRLTADEGRWLAKVEPQSGRVLMNAVTLSHAMRIGRRRSPRPHGSHFPAASATGSADEIDVRLGEGPINSLRIAAASWATSRRFLPPAIPAGSSGCRRRARFWERSKFTKER